MALVTKSGEIIDGNNFIIRPREFSAVSMKMMDVEPSLSEFRYLSALLAGVIVSYTDNLSCSVHTGNLGV